MAELRHSSSIGSRAASPRKRDDVGAASSPLSPGNLPAASDEDDDDNRNRHSRDRGLRSLFSPAHLHSLFPFSFTDDARVHTHNSKISVFVLFLIFLAGIISVYSIVYRLVSVLNLAQSSNF